jgi:hypothetical protein
MARGASMPPTKRRRRGGAPKDWTNGVWQGPDVWTRANGEPSAARLVAEALANRETAGPPTVDYFVKRS